MYSDPDCALPMEFVDSAWRECELKKTDRTMHAAGGLGTSINDAARWLILHLNDGEIDGQRVLSPAAAREMRTLIGKLPKPNGSLRIMQGFGLGWQVGAFHGTPLCSHGGGYIGTQTYYAMLPEKKAGFAILMNAGGAAQGLGDIVAIDILDRLIDGDEHVDVMEAYRKELPQRKQQLAERLAARAAAARAAPSFSVPTASYEGRFAHADLGTITIKAGPAEGCLIIQLGDCRFDTAPTDPPAPDRLLVLGPAAEDVVLTFVTSPSGAIDAVKLAIPDGGEYTFERSTP